MIQFVACQTKLRSHNVRRSNFFDIVPPMRRRWVRRCAEQNRGVQQKSLHSHCSSHCPMSATFLPTYLHAKDGSVTVKRLMAAHTFPSSSTIALGGWWVFLAFSLELTLLINVNIFKRNILKGGDHFSGFHRGNCLLA